jgi:hypothetical protein
LPSDPFSSRGGGHHDVPVTGLDLGLDVLRRVPFEPVVNLLGVL